MVVSKRGIKIDWAQLKQRESHGFSREMYYRGGPLSSSLSAPIHYIYLYALSAVELLFIACSLTLSLFLHTHTAIALTLGGEHRARSDTKIFDLSAPSPRTLYILISLSLAFSLVNNVQTLSITYHRCLFCRPLFIFCSDASALHTLSSVNLSIWEPSCKEQATHSTLYGVFQSSFSPDTINSQTHHKRSPWDVGSLLDTSVMILHNTHFLRRSSVTCK